MLAFLCVCVCVCEYAYVEVVKSIQHGVLVKILHNIQLA